MEKIHLILITTLILFLFDISGKDDNYEQLENI